MKTLVSPEGKEINAEVVDFYFVYDRNTNSIKEGFEYQGFAGEKVGPFYSRDNLIFKKGDEYFLVKMEVEND